MKYSSSWVRKLAALACWIESMSTFAPRASVFDVLARLKAWWPIVLGLLVLYVPTYWILAHGIWNSEEQAHGPIVLVVALFLIWQQRAIFLADTSSPPA